MQHGQPISLEQIFSSIKSQRSRKVILLEGASGCGKSTLSMHIAQQAIKGELFEGLPYVPILVRLHEPEVQGAECLRDLLPQRDTEAAANAAREMTKNHCKGFLFILEGWDHLPLEVQQKSIFRELIEPTFHRKHQVDESAVIVTSQPIGSARLHQYVSTRVEIHGFTPDKLKEFFTESLDGDLDKVSELMEKVEANPAVVGSCYLPLSASILLHLYQCGNNTLPTTQYGIFSELALSCIDRYLQLHKEGIEIDADCLDEIPESIRPQFDLICRIAYMKE